MDSSIWLMIGEGLAVVLAMGFADYFFLAWTNIGLMFALSFFHIWEIGNG